MFAQAFEAVGKDSFLFRKGDEDWARKRKACAHAFYKDRTENMMEVLKDKLSDMVTSWMKEIEASPNGSTVIDLAVVFERLFASNIVHICFGEDVS